MSTVAVGFIGLGNMGGRITRQLVNSGQPVLGFDAVPTQTEAAGATRADSIKDVLAQSDLVFLSLPNSSVIENVVLGDDGFLAEVRAGQVVVDLSTAAPESTRRIAALMAQRGATYIDAGISGGAAAAERGALTLMVGGDAAILESIRPTLHRIADHIFYVGDSGAGHATKILNNFLNAVALSATAETMIAAKKAGLDLDVVLQVMNASSGVNFATLNRFPHIVHGDYLTGGLTNSLMMKDITLYTDYLANLGVAGLNASGPLASFGLALSLGYADKISNTVVDALGDVSGGIRLSGFKETDAS